MAGSGATTSKEGTDYSKRPVPQEGRAGAASLTMAWWSCCSAMFWIVVAATLASVYGTWNTIIGLVLTIITYGIINAVITRYAIRTGLSVSLFSRLLFGTTGSALATLIFAATAIYYAVFEGSVIALAATFLYPGLGYWIAALLVVAYSVPLVFGSVQNWLDKFNGVLLPVYLLGLVVAVGLGLHAHGYSNKWLHVAGAAPSPSGWWNVYAAYMGVWIMMMFTFDYARFGKPRDERYHALVNFGAPFYVVALLVSGLVGIFLVNTIPVEGALSEVSAVKAIIVLMGLLGLVFVWVTQTRINTANYYLAAVNLESLGRLTLRLSWPKTVWAIVVGVIVYLLMMGNMVHYILTALAYQGIFVVAWVGVALAYILRQAPQEPADAGGQPDSSYPAFNPSGLLAWFGSVILGIVLMNIPGLDSFSAPATAISSFAAFLVAGTSSRLVNA
jgi:hypothetical protein